MGCFCHRTLGPLTLGLPRPERGAECRALPHANVALSLAGWLGARGLPAAPWQPDPNWLRQMLPRLRMSASAMATVSALAQLRAQVLAQFGIDLLLPGSAAAFARIVATMNARLSAMASASFNPGAWIGLAGLNAAIDRVNLALQAGLLAPSASLAMTTPGGLAMADWRAFLAALAGLAPLIAAASQLNISLAANFSAQLAAALRTLRGIALPGFSAANLAFMASLTGALSAVAQLHASLGIDPLALGFPAVQAMVSARLTRHALGTRGQPAAEPAKPQPAGRAARSAAEPAILPDQSRQWRHGPGCPRRACADRRVARLAGAAVGFAAGAAHRPARLRVRGTVAGGAGHFGRAVGTVRCEL